jgi:hypothetical protein
MCSLTIEKWLSLSLIMSHYGFRFFQGGPLLWQYFIPVQYTRRQSTASFSVGDSRSMKRQFTEHDVTAFSKLSQDYNPIHLNKDHVNFMFRQRRVVQGMLLATMFSSIFGNWYPGKGSIYLSQSLKFLRPGKGKILLTSM